MLTKSKDLFESIGSFSHNLGIYLTYTLSKNVVVKLTDYASATFLILHDYSQGESLDFIKDNQVCCLPINITGVLNKNCFHSKLILLKSENRAKLIVGSANLSEDSFLTEKEIALEVELNFDKLEEMYLYNQVVDYLGTLVEQLPIGKDVYIQTLKKFRDKHKKTRKSKSAFIYNSDTCSILDRIEDFIKENCRNKPASKIRIATPFVSDSYDFTRITNISTRIFVYTRKGARIDPFVKSGFKVYQPKDKQRAGFHAKIFMIEYNKFCVLYIGSANFTNQGYFLNNSEDSNQECGIISIVNKKEMDHWFDTKSWCVVNPEIYEEDKENLSLESFEPDMEGYAWAEKQKRKIITFLYNPKNQIVRQNGRKISTEPHDEKFHFYKTDKLICHEDLIKFKLGDNDIEIPVFDPEKFNEASDYRNEGLFTLFKGDDSVIHSESQKALEKERISIKSPHSDVYIKEPPFLEHHYHKVKQFIRHISRKKSFTDYNKDELERELKKMKSGADLYTAVQLFKCFTDKKYDSFADLCKKRAQEIGEDLGLNNFEEFLEKWH